MAPTPSSTGPSHPPPTVTELEAELGLGFYSTQTPGIGGRLRTVPEDFEVKEDSAPIIKAQAKGKYTLARIRARNWETHKLIRRIGSELGIPERSIYFTGTKDKRAVTIQNLALAAPEEQVQQLDLRDIKILETYRVDRAPKLGEHTGNAFKIKIRECEASQETVRKRTRRIETALKDAGGFPNFFGPQRFGSVRPTTHLVGKAILEKDFEKAVWTYVAYPTGYEKDSFNATREKLWSERDPRKARELLPRRFDYEHQMLKHLEQSPGDYQGALTELPLNLTRLFVSAFQSHLFNKALTQRARGSSLTHVEPGDILQPLTPDGLPDTDRQIPVHPHNLDRCQEAVNQAKAVITAALPGYEPLESYGVQREIESQILKESGITQSDFRILDLPKLSSNGTRRAAWCPLTSLSTHHGEDRHGPFTELAFFLPKGAYATCLLREFMKTDLAQY